MVQPRGAPNKPTLFAIPRWLAGGAAHVDHTLPPRRSPTPCLLNTLGAEVVQSRLFLVPPRPGAWSNHAAPGTNPHYLLFRAGWRGAPRNLDHTLPPRRSPTPCLLNTLGAEVVHSKLFFVPPNANINININPNINIRINIIIVSGRL